MIKEYITRTVVESTTADRRTDLIIWHFALLPTADNVDNLFATSGRSPQRGPLCIGLRILINSM